MTTILKVAPNGRMCIPAEIRERLGLKDGGTLILQEMDGGLILKTHEQRVREVQARFAHLRAKLPSVDAFLKDRRSTWGEKA